jgi:hypothetical protein
MYRRHNRYIDNFFAYSLLHQPEWRTNILENPPNVEKVKHPFPVNIRFQFSHHFRKVTSLKSTKQVDHPSQVYDVDYELPHLSDNFSPQCDVQ